MSTCAWRSANTSAAAAAAHDAHQRRQATQRCWRRGAAVTHAPPPRAWRRTGRCPPGAPRSAQWRCSRRCPPRPSPASAPVAGAIRQAHAPRRRRASLPRCRAARLAQRVQLEEGCRLVGHAHLERRAGDLHAVVLRGDERLGGILAAGIRPQLELRAHGEASAPVPANCHFPGMAAAGPRQARRASRRAQPTRARTAMTAAP
jgi:hypothetical protein